MEYERERSSCLEISMLGRDAHITSNLLMNYCVAISYVNSSVPLSTTLFERECICETMNPGPILIIRNNFQTTIIHFLFPAIYKFENTKNHLLLAFTIQNTIYHCYHHLCIPPLHIYFLFAYLLLLVCITYYLLYCSYTLCLTTTWRG